MFCTRCAFLVDTEGLAGSAQADVGTDASEATAPEPMRDAEAAADVALGGDADASATDAAALDADGGGSPGTR